MFVQIGGVTLHRLFGWRGSEYVFKYSPGDTAYLRLQLARVIFVDEISMMNNLMFQAILSTLNRIPLPGKEGQPFGGRILIWTGDFCQLPPVLQRGELPVWQDKLFRELFTFYELSVIHRQGKDAKFAEFLQAIRKRFPTDKEIDYIKQAVCPGGLNGCEKCLHWVGRKDSATLSSHKKIRDNINDVHLAKQDGELFRYIAHDYDLRNKRIDDNPSGKNKLNLQLIDKISKKCSGPKVLSLKVGCPVIITKNCNFEAGVINGARGVVLECFKSMVKIKLDRNDTVVLVKAIDHIVKLNDNTVYKRQQLPVLPAYCITTHRAQGITVKYLRVQLTAAGRNKQGFWEHGQAYVALSRVGSLANLHLTDFDPKAFIYNQGLLDWLESLPFNACDD